MPDCIFCKIIKGEIPSYKVYEDDDILAFLDLTPVSPGHTLVIPKAHHKDLLELPDDLAGKIITVIKKITPAILQGVGATDFNLGFNNGKIAGQVVEHAHFHIIPRIENDGHQHWHGKEYPYGEAEKTLEKIKRML